MPSSTIWGVGMTQWQSLKPTPSLPKSGVTSDYPQGSFDRSLMASQPLVNGKQVGLPSVLRVRAENKRQAAAIHCQVSAYYAFECFDSKVVVVFQKSLVSLSFWAERDCEAFPAPLI